MAYSNSNLLPQSASTFEGGVTAWVADPANTTVSVSSTESLSGTRSMRITAKGAGSVAATSPRVTVAEGVTYTAYIPVRTNTTTVGRVAVATWTFFDAPSGGNAVGAASFTRDLADSAGWVASHVLCPWAEAPAGAVSATLTYSVSGLAAGEYVNLDNVYACLAPVVSGNLLDWGTSSVEDSVSAWNAGSNTTVAREVGDLVDPDGYFLLLMSSVDAGRADITSGMIPVTAGTEYVAYARAYPLAGAVATRQEIHWYDEDGVLISKTERTDSITTGYLLYIKCVGTAPANATQACVCFAVDADAPAVNVVFNHFVFQVAPNAPGNLLTYDEYSSESEVKPWALDGGTDIRRAQQTSPITDGYYMLAFTPASEGVIYLGLDRLIPVSPGVTYTAQGSYFGSTSGPEQTTIAYRARIDWYDADGVLFQADNPDQFYTTTVPADGKTYGGASTEARKCPEGAAYARIGFEFDHSLSLVDTYYVDSAILKESSPEYTLTSDDETGSITFNVMWVYADGTAVTVERVDESGAVTKIRGYGTVYDKAPYTPGPFVVEDYEAPLATQVSYRVTFYKSSGERGDRLFTQTIAAPILEDGDYVWFKSPGIPALNTQVMMEAPPKWSRASRSTQYDIVGRKNPVHITGVRGGNTASITLLVWDEADNAQFNALLDSGLPAFIQAMPGYGMGGSRYLSIGDVDVEPLSPNARDDGWRWTLDVREIDRPEGGLQGSARKTWQTVLSEYDSWDDLFAANSSWTEVLIEG